MFDSILVVCTGNICRSPIGERILRREFPNKKIDSAGIGALVGHPADDSAVLVAEENGISLSNHEGKQFTSALSRSYDLILVMDKEHLEGISRIAPEVRGKTMLLGHWLGSKEIPDPYRKSVDAFRSVYQLIDCACKTWVPKLKD